MAIDQFSKERFEAALPKHKDLGHNLWTYEGFQGEHVYRLHIGGNVYVKIWSSIGPSGFADGTGENSIRCFLVNLMDEPLSNKLQTYVTRVAGWEGRLKDQLKQLWQMGQKIVVLCTEPLRGNPGILCHTQKKVFMTKNGPNKGRRFTKCSGCGAFEWIDEANTVKLAS